MVTCYHCFQLLFSTVFPNTDDGIKWFSSLILSQKCLGLNKQVVGYEKKGQTNASLFLE